MVKRLFVYSRVRKKEICQKHKKTEPKTPSIEHSPLENMATILALDTVPPFAGPSGEYKLKAQDMARIPRKMAEILAEKTGKIRILD
mgnify:CR=1 FL=1